jgi:hypothetical protein
MKTMNILNFKAIKFNEVEISKLIATDVINIMQYKSKVLQLLFDNPCML